MYFLWENITFAKRFLMDTTTTFSDFEHKSFHNLNAEIHYWHKKGSANKHIILLHGAACNHLMFAQQIAALGSTHTIIAWDARGHGMSKMNDGTKFSFKDMYFDCLKLLENHNVKDAVLIGHSMGGNLAQEIVYRRAELSAKCILIDCTINTQKLSVIERMSLKMSRTIFNLYPWKTLAKQCANACGATEYARKYMQDCFESMSKENFVEVMMSLLACLHEDAAFRFAQPALLICGNKDRTGNIKKSMRSHAKNDSNCRLHLIENAAHNANQDNPEEVNRCIEMFLGNK
jgi:pimeloyl-ACP methyl ester carboxylesterase